VLGQITTSKEAASLGGAKGREMKRVNILGFIFLAVVAFCATITPSAFAVDEWLANGAAIAAPLAVQTEMELTLIQLEKAAGLILEEILCSLVMDGTAGPLAADSVESLLNLVNEIIGGLGEKSLVCEVIANNGAVIACKNKTPVEFWVDNLPWKTEIELMTKEPFFLDHFFAGGAGKEVGYEFKCEVIGGIIIEELCEGLRSAALENEPTGVLVTFNWEIPIETEFAECTLLGANTGGLKGSGVMKLTNLELLSVS
jgi:hypothetical protein